jgi:diaminohydroxyphosphoribosylaminopyrimidine deaminase/5-amino-6-(5-phosphoribosylamino)uracil reductase
MSTDCSPGTWMFPRSPVAAERRSFIWHHRAPLHMSEHDSLKHDLPRTFMQRAIEQMRCSEKGGPRVGAVLVLDDRVISVGCRSRGIHAERAAIDEATRLGIDVRGATLYSTLEPCVSTGAEKEPCVALIVRAGIKTVYIGRYDTNPLIYRAGWKVLRDAVSRSETSTSTYGQKSMLSTRSSWSISCREPDPGAEPSLTTSLNEGGFEIQYSKTDERSILTRWTQRGTNSIYAYAIQPVRVALARHAREFGEIDDPRAFDFNYTVPVEVGEIAVFVSHDGAALVKVTEVSSEKGQTFVKIKYEVRTWQ